MSGPKQLQNLRVSALDIDSTHAAMEVAVVDASGNQITGFGTGGTQYTEGDTDATITGNAQLVEGAGNTLLPTQGSTAIGSVGDFGVVVRPIPLRASTVTRSSVTQSSTSVTLSVANSSRLGWSVYNRPTESANLFVKFGATASTSDFDVMVPADGFYELDPIHTLRIDGVWDSTGAGFARVVEYQP